MYIHRSIRVVIIDKSLIKLICLTESSHHFKIFLFYIIKNNLNRK